MSNNSKRPTIARIWSGRTRRNLADEYEAYNREAGIKPLIAKAMGVQSFREDRVEETEFVTISYWESVEAMSRFTGGEPTGIHHLARDPEFLIELPQRVQVLKIRGSYGNVGTHGDVRSKEPTQQLNIPFAGGCGCGAIRYECTAEPLEMFQCHCRDCQRVTGGESASVVIVPAKAFKLTRGALRYHFTPSAAMGHHKRSFCSECGSRMTGGENREGTSSIVGINAGSLDDPSWFRPQYHIFVSDAQPWDCMDPALPKHEKYAPQTTNEA